MSRARTKVLILAGPTGVGKTLIATCISRLLGGEIISCDSVQVYKELNIGSNKEHLEVQQHLINLVSWKESFSAGHYYDACIPIIRDISSRGKVPLVVGGTNFYVTWLIHGKPSAPQATREITQRIHDMTHGRTWQENLSLLIEYDPVYAATLQENDYYRLYRALGIVLMTGQPLSCFSSRMSVNEIERHVENDDIKISDPSEEFDFRCFYLTHDRFHLARLIDKRCEEMIQKGLICEVLELKRAGLSAKQHSAGRAIGYQQTLLFLDRMEALINDPTNENLERDADQCFLSFMEDFQSASRQYGRRQDVWFKTHPMFHWCHWELFDSDSEKIANFIATMFGLENNEFNFNEVLKNISKNSLEKRFNSLTERKMRTFRTNLVIYNDRHARKVLIHDLITLIKSK